MPLNPGKEAFHQPAPLIATQSSAILRLWSDPVPSMRCDHLGQDHTGREDIGAGIDLEIRRAGGAIRLGRPLPLAYTRLFVSYGLENQSVVDETNDTDLVDYFVTGFRVDQENSLSSNLAFTLVRNSTDHPIYPTIGSNARLRTEFAGGFLGGDQVFQKYELDVSRYLRTVNLGGWKPILMLRSRLGAIGEGFRDFPLIPERFEVDEDKVEATCRDGVLTVTLAKSEKARPKRIRPRMAVGAV